MQVSQPTQLATINFRLSNYDLVAGESLGQPGGYATLAEAAAAATAATAGPAAAAAVLERAGRFELVSLMASHRLVGDDRPAAPAQPFGFIEHVATSPFPQLVKDFRLGPSPSQPIDPALRAVIDGRTMITPSR